MSFGDEIFRALTGRSAEPASAEEMFREAEQYRYEIGLSRRGFAKQSGIPESTLRYWGQQGFTGKSDAANLPRLTRAYRSLISSPAAVERWKQNGMTIHVDNVPGSRGRTESRQLDAHRLKLAPGTGAAVVKAFMDGDDKKAAQTFMKGIGDPWYRQVMFGSWLANHDDDLSDLAYEGAEYDGMDDYFVTASAS